MTSRRLLVPSGVGLLFLVGIVVLVTASDRVESSADSCPAGAPERARILRTRSAMPTATESEIAQLMDESDTITELVASREPRTNTRYLLHAMERLPIPEQEARVYHAAHPEVFGSRSFESCRVSIERILRSQRIRGARLPPEDEWEWEWNENKSDQPDEKLGPANGDAAAVDP